MTEKYLTAKQAAEKLQVSTRTLSRWEKSGTLTPKRIKMLNDKGWYLKKIITSSVKKWRGRYLFLIFTKEKCDFHETLIGNF